MVPDKIRIQDLRKGFSARTGRMEALGPVDITIGDGEFFCIVGPSGCGKSTLLRIIAGLETYSSGEIQIAHADVSRPLTSMVFQEHALYPWMTVLENAAFGLEMQGVNKRERSERVRKFLDLVGLTKFQDYYPAQLSGGMRQRVSLVRAFVMEPEVLLMDEPFAALDAQNKILLQDELIRIWEHNRKAVIYVTHSIEEALILGDRIAVMTAVPGRLKEVIPVPFARPRNSFEIRATPQFSKMYEQIWHTLEAEVRQSREMA